MRSTYKVGNLLGRFSTARPLQTFFSLPVVAIIIQRTPAATTSKQESHNINKVIWIILQPIFGILSVEKGERERESTHKQVVLAPAAFFWKFRKCLDSLLLLKRKYFGHRVSVLFLSQWYIFFCFSRRDISDSASIESLCLILNASEC